MQVDNTIMLGCVDYKNLEKKKNYNAILYKELKFIFKYIKMFDK